MAEKDTPTPGTSVVRIRTTLPNVYSRSRSVLLGHHRRPTRCICSVNESQFSHGMSQKLMTIRTVAVKSVKGQYKAPHEQGCSNNRSDYSEGY